MLAEVTITVVVLLPTLAWVAGRLAGLRAVAGALWASTLSAAVCVGAVAAGGSAALRVGGTAGRPALGLVATPFGSCLALLVTAVGATVVSYATRYLQADRSPERFGAAAAGVVAAMTVVCTSATLAGLVVAWIAAGAAFLSVLRYRPDLPGTSSARASAAQSLLLGDGCLVAALVIVSAVDGNVPLERPSLSVAAHHLGAWRPLVGVLVVVAAVARCAQAPFGRWLRLTVSAPTPACALLHAGVVNGGGILLIRLGAVGAWRPAMIVLAVVSGSFAVWSGAVMSAQPDVKGQLARSTAAQMAFMLLECATGAYPAAVVHLIGHGLYKSSLFLSSGSVLPQPGLPPRSTVRPGRPALIATAAGAVAAAAAAAAGAAAGDGAVLGTFAALTALVFGMRFWAVRPAATRPGAIAILALGGAGYGAVVAAVGRFVGHGLGSPPGVIPRWWLLAFIVAVSLVALVERTSLRGRWRALVLDAAFAPADWAARPPRPHRVTSPRTAWTVWTITPEAA